MAVTTTGLILAAQGVSAATSAAQAYGQASAYKQEGRHQNSIANFNAGRLDAGAADVSRIGDLEARKQLSAAKRLQAEQRTRVAGQNVDVGFGTPAQAIEETRALGAREAMGYSAGAVGERMKGRLAQVAGRMNANASLATGGMAMSRAILAGADAYSESPYLLESQKPSSSPAYGKDFMGPVGPDR
jgi:hypothetical protein